MKFKKFAKAISADLLNRNMKKQNKNFSGNTVKRCKTSLTIMSFALEYCTLVIQIDLRRALLTGSTVFIVSLMR